MKAAIQSIAIIGSGYMGGGIAQVFASAGITTIIADVSIAETERNYKRLLKETEDFIKEGLYDQQAMQLIATHLKYAQSIEEAVLNVDLVMEVVPEVFSIKQEVLARISQATAKDTIIASNTSTISINELAQSVQHAARFLGVHFSNPAPFIPGVEIIPHKATDERIIPVIEALLKAAGKQSARINDATGFVLNRLQYALFHEATQLIEEGVASATDIDTIVRTTFGFRLPFFGPFAIADMAGLDVYSFCYKSLQGTFPTRFETPKILKDLVDNGKLGTKTSAGFLNVPAERTAQLIAYRNKAYVQMQKLLDDLGPAPID